MVGSERVRKKDEARLSKRVIEREVRKKRMHIRGK